MMTSTTRQTLKYVSTYDLSSNNHNRVLCSAKFHPNVLISVILSTAHRLHLKIGFRLWIINLYWIDKSASLFVFAYANTTLGDGFGMKHLIAIININRICITYGFLTFEIDIYVSNSSSSISFHSSHATSKSILSLTTSWSPAPQVFALLWVLLKKCQKRPMIWICDNLCFSYHQCHLASHILHFADMKRTFQRPS